MQQFRDLRCLLAIPLLAFALGMPACSGASPEAGVRARLAAMQEAIDARDAGAVQDLLAEDFVGNEGMDRHAVRQLAVAVFLRHRDVAAKLGPVDVEVRGQADAIARFSVLATGGSGGLLPDSGQLYQVETGWRLVDGDWKLLNASWKPAL